ncbi:MAG: aspartate--ammonia ligase [Chitinophagaceae bacterium]|nr:aspartate--ammonia ligase [Chitinophagaceae bacterium]MCW5904082.1 aspartate--ammonia ligase [Chitinophagaceae bacterium]
MNKVLQTEAAITIVKDTFTRFLCNYLHLTKISSPLMVLDGTGINDDLNGVERPVSFPVKFLNEQRAVIVHSLAKWKRVRLKELEVEEGRGILTDMRALRPDEDYSHIHSIYVDQWDWEKHITKADRNLSYLKHTVTNIYKAIVETEHAIQQFYPDNKPILPEKIQFIHAEELLQKYPTLTPKQRENAITKEYGAVFLIGIGHNLSNNEPHDLRAADYDDWSTKNDDNYYGLNGDILFWNPVLESAFEISSMGIRVDKQSLTHQLKEKNDEHKASLSFHKMLLEGELPESVGGGIGQSRLSMFLLKKSHIGEVQVSIWSDKERAYMKSKGVELL